MKNLVPYMTQAIVASSLPKGTEDFHEIMKSKWFLSIPATNFFLKKHHGWIGYVDNVVFFTWAGAIFEVYLPIWTIFRVYSASVF